MQSIVILTYVRRKYKWWLFTANGECRTRTQHTHRWAFCVTVHNFHCALSCTRQILWSKQVWHSETSSQHRCELLLVRAHQQIVASCLHCGKCEVQGTNTASRPFGKNMTSQAIMNPKEIKTNLTFPAKSSNWMDKFSRAIKTKQRRESHTLLMELLQKCNVDCHCLWCPA